MKFLVDAQLPRRMAHWLAVKDRGFADSITLSGTPYKLLLVTTGNMSNSELERLFERNLSQLEESLTRFDFVELGRGFVVSHL